MRPLIAIFICAVMFASTLAAQNWKKVHTADDAKWAKATGLDPITVHKLWRAASTTQNEKEDSSRIASLDVEGLAVRHDVLLVTYAGEKNCLTITVFRQFSPTRFEKVWSVNQPPDATGFCDNEFGSAAAVANDGTVLVRVPHSMTNGGTSYTVYGYEWNGITYRFVGQKEAVR